MKGLEFDAVFVSGPSESDRRRAPQDVYRLLPRAASSAPVTPMKTYRRLDIVL
jgi:DNA helicase IV